jgi:hypothetical protein
MRLRFATPDNDDPQPFIPRGSRYASNMLKNVSDRRSYFLARALTTFLALIFALGYSRSLGLTNRSLIAFVMTSNSMIWILATSGTTLTLRKLKPMLLNSRISKSFVSLLSLEIVAAFIFFLATNLIYSRLKNELPRNLLIGVLVYFFFSGMHLICNEILIAFERFRLAGILDLVTIVIQIFVFSLLVFFDTLSLANSLLLAFAISYLTVSLITLIILKKSFNIVIGFSSPKEFYLLTKGNHSLGFTLAVMDRLDRLLIGILLPTEMLGRFAVTSGMFTVFRFIPNATSKLLMSKSHSALPNWIASKRIVLTLTLVLTLVTLFGSRLVVEFWLGASWLLPLSVTFLILVQEIIRGAFEINSNKSIVDGFSDLVHKQSVLVPVFAILIAYFSTQIFGIIAIPLTFSLIYLWGILFLKAKASKS